MISQTDKPVGDWTPRLAQMSLTRRPWPTDCDWLNDRHANFGE